MSDLYRLLEVLPDADEGEIESAHRRLAKKYHPDRNPGDKAAEARFKDMQNAYDILGDAVTRARYDRGDLRQHKPPRIDVLRVSLSGLINGGTYEVGGSSLVVPYDVTIEPQTRVGKIIAVPRADFYVRIELKTERWFTVSGNDLRACILLSEEQLANGATIRLEVPHDKKAVRVRPGKSSGDVVTFPRLGLPLGDGKFGNLILTLKLKDESGLNTDNEVDEAALEFNEVNFPKYAALIKEARRIVDTITGREPK
jgi:DnaJ-class molecular chaperone